MYDVLLSFECIYEERLLTSMDGISYTTSRIIFSIKYEIFFLCFLVALYFICKTRLTSGGVSLIKIIPFFPSAWLEINKTEFYFIFARMKNFRLFICSFSYFMAALFTIYHRYSNNSSKF